MSERIHGYFRERSTRETIEGLLEAGTHPLAPRKKKQTPWSGKTFVFTGSLDDFSRAEVERLVESLGARATSSVSGETDYVVAGESPGRKRDDAEEQGVPILDESDFVEMLEEAELDLESN
jgi:DNA ligase (NAD+)